MRPVIAIEGPFASNKQKQNKKIKDGKPQKLPVERGWRTNSDGGDGSRNSNFGLMVDRHYFLSSLSTQSN